MKMIIAKAILFTIMGTTIVGMLFINRSLNHENDTLTRDVAERNSRISSLTVQLLNCQQSQENLIAAKSQQETTIKELKSFEDNRLQMIEEIVRTASDGGKYEVKSEVKNISVNIMLPDDLTRLLKEHCDSIRGKTCTDP